MIVVDNSVLIAALVDENARGKACAQRLFGESMTAPSLLDYEAIHALRGLVLGRVISAQVAGDALATLQHMPIERKPCAPLMTRMWELRSNYTSYDASYIALAEQLDLTLVTGDARLQRAGGARCVVELIR